MSPAEAEELARTARECARSLELIGSGVDEKIVFSLAKSSPDELDAASLFLGAQAREAALQSIRLAGVSGALAAAARAAAEEAPEAPMTPAKCGVRESPPGPPDP